MSPSNGWVTNTSPTSALPVASPQRQRKLSQHGPAGMFQKTLHSRLRRGDICIYIYDICADVFMHIMYFVHRDRVG